MPFYTEKPNGDPVGTEKSRRNWCVIRTCPPDFIDTKEQHSASGIPGSIGLPWLAAQEAFAGEAENIVSPHDSARAKQINATSQKPRVSSRAASPICRPSSRGAPVTSISR
jgi:hypothetical protein